MRPAYIILLGILALLLAVLGTRIRFRIKADADVRLTLEILFFKKQLFPKEEEHPDPKKFTKKGLERQIKRLRKKAEKQQKKKTEKAAKKQAKAEAKKAAAATDTKKKKMSVAEIIELVILLSRALISNLSRRLHIDVKRLNIIVATGDAASTAVLYGTVSAAVASLTELLITCTRTKLPTPEHGGVYADFVGDSSSVDAELLFSMRVYQVFFTLVSIAYKYLKNQLKKSGNK